MEYFSIDEFRCKCCNELPENGMNQILLNKLDDMRGRIGAPIIVTCGYRCASHNEAVGGIPNSQHVLGNAADIYCDSLSVDELAGYCVEEGFDGIGRYYNSGFVHCDVRDNGDSPNYYTWTDQD